jgi:hypothetical protein
VADEACRAWALETFGRAAQPDARLNVRLLKTAGALAARPSDSIPQACGKAKAAKGAYRFIENKRVNTHALLRASGQATAGRCSGRPSVLAIQDTSIISLTHHPQTRGLGPIDEAGARGLLVHSTLAVSTEGETIGLLDAQMWTRDPNDRHHAQKRRSLPIEEKESVKWLRGMEGARRAFATLPSPLWPRLIHVMDREGDIHEVFEDIVKAGDGAVVRAMRNRLVDDPNRLAYETARASPVLERRSIQVRRQENHPARTAQVEVRACRVHLTPDTSHWPDHRPLDLTLVEVWEPNAPADVEPLHWRIWTTERVETSADARKVIGFYGNRWRIEDVHLTLKSGCRIEERQFEAVDRIERALALYLNIAVRIVRLRDSAKNRPDAPCTEELADEEWRALWGYRNKCRAPREQKPPTLREAILWIGALGGHMGRKADGMPGVRTLWKGWRDLMLLTDAYRVYRSIEQSETG